MPYEERYSGIVQRLKDTLKNLTLKLLGMYFLVALVVGGVTAWALYTYTPKAFENDKGKPVVWMVGLTSALVGLAAGAGAWWGGLI